MKIYDQHFSYSIILQLPSERICLASDIYDSAINIFIKVQTLDIFLESYSVFIMW